jgi:flavodoxin
MKALVVYETFFGNTERIARAIGEGLGSPEEVQVRQVGDVKPEQLVQLTLLVVGSPTRAFRPTPATKAFLRAIPQGALQGVRAAAFDTRIDTGDIKSSALRFMVNLFGYAAKPIAKRLGKKGAQLVAPGEGFCVAESEGPLKEGELERAAAWARQIAAGLSGAELWP